jgi:mycofactocin precursor
MDHHAKCSDDPRTRPERARSPDPSGWVGDCPVGEFRCGTACHSVEAMDDANKPETTPAVDQLVEETLVEEVMIDGMCGVY